MLAVKEQKREEKQQDRLYTLIEFERDYLTPEDNNRLFELINGKVYEKMPTQEHGLVASNINLEFGLYAREHKNGRPGVEVRHQAQTDDRNSRLPDVSFTCTRAPLVEQGSVPGMPDVAVEIKSPNDTIKEMRETALYYLANGSRLVWLIYPAQQVVEVYRPDADVEILTSADLLSGYDVMPGFELLVAEVFTDPFGQ